MHHKPPRRRVSYGCFFRNLHMRGIEKKSRLDRASFAQLIVSVFARAVCPHAVRRPPLSAPPCYRRRDILPGCPVDGFARSDVCSGGPVDSFPR